MLHIEASKRENDWTASRPCAFWRGGLPAGQERSAGHDCPPLPLLFAVPTGRVAVLACVVCAWQGGTTEIKIFCAVAKAPGRFVLVGK